MLVAVLFIGLVLFIAIGWTRSVRLAARRELAIDVLGKLGKAVDAYHRAHGEDPPETHDLSADAAIEVLRRDPASRQIVSTIPPHLWTTDPPPRLLDPWGTGFRYLGPVRGASRVTANAGRSVMVSAGPDRDFGDARSADLGDNLASDDPVVLDRFALGAAAASAPSSVPASAP